MERKSPYPIHLTELIRCSKFSGKIPDIVLDYGIKAHGKFYKEFREMCPEAKIEERFSMIISNTILVFSPDIIYKNVVYELKRSSKSMTIYHGSIQLLCYINLLRKMGYEVDGGMLILIDAMGKSTNAFEFNYYDEYDDVIWKWLVNRVKQHESGFRKPVSLFECSECRNRYCKLKYVIDDFPLSLYIHHKLFGRSIMEYFG